MQPYTQRFFEEQQRESLGSAREIVPMVMQWVRPRRVLDLGCGVGAWLRVFQECGAEAILGVDGDYVDRSLSMIPPERFVAHDLNQPFGCGESFDLAVSLEVAEHLAPESGAELVSTLTRLAPVVLFSAAVPGQGGVSHLNEQWQDYWAGLFSERGFTAVDCVRPRIWDNPRVMWWYAQNTLLYVSREHLHRLPMLSGSAPREPLPLRLVHPAMYSGLRYCTDPRHMSFRMAWRTFRVALRHAISRRLAGAGNNERSGGASAAALSGLELERM